MNQDWNDPLAGKCPYCNIEVFSPERTIATLESASKAEFPCEHFIAAWIEDEEFRSCSIFDDLVGSHTQRALDLYFWDKANEASAFNDYLWLWRLCKDDNNMCFGSDIENKDFLVKLEGHYGIVAQRWATPDADIDDTTRFTALFSEDRDSTECHIRRAVQALEDGALGLLGEYCEYCDAYGDDCACGKHAAPPACPICGEEACRDDDGSGWGLKYLHCGHLIYGNDDNGYDRSRLPQLEIPYFRDEWLGKSFSAQDWKKAFGKLEPLECALASLGNYYRDEDLLQALKPFLPDLVCEEFYNQAANAMGGWSATMYCVDDVSETLETIQGLLSKLEKGYRKLEKWYPLDKSLV